MHALSMNASLIPVLSCMGPISLVLAQRTVASWGVCGAAFGPPTRPFDHILVAQVLVWGELGPGFPAPHPPQPSTCNCAYAPTYFLHFKCCLCLGSGSHQRGARPVHRGPLVWRLLVPPPISSSVVGQTSCKFVAAAVNRRPVAADRRPP